MNVSSVKLFFQKKISDPLFYLALILSGFWLADTWYKIFVQGAPTRMLWYSSAGLGLIIIGLLFRSTFFLTGMFCLLMFQESAWYLSFFSNLISIKDYFLFADYAFGATFPRIALYITLYHLLLLPSIIFGLIKVKKVSKKGWLVAYITALIICYLPYIFPNKEDVNCVRGDIAGCRLYFGPLYGFGPVFRIFLGVTFQLFLLFIPINFLLNVITKRARGFMIHEENYNK